MGLRSGTALGGALLTLSACGTTETGVRFQGEACERLTWYADADQDGFGDPGVASLSCDAPPGYRPVAGDCDDRDPAVNPAAVEVCGLEGVDEDCDGLVDEADPGLSPEGALQRYPDGDGDGFGRDGAVSLGCELGPGEVGEGGDCDDADPSVHPDATEICGDAPVDEDCDGLVDDADPDLDLGSVAGWTPDRDGDGYGDAEALPVFTCAQPVGGGWSEDPTDCDDADPEVHPGAEERCDGVDADCDGDATDAGLATFEDPDGLASDLTATLAAGTSDEAAVVLLTEPGRLRVCPGTWSVRLEVEAEGLVVEGLGGPAEVVLDAREGGSVVAVLGGEVQLSGLGLRGGLAPSGGGLLVEDAQVLVEDLHISECLAEQGGGGLAVGAGGAVEALDLVVDASEALSRGGGVVVTAGGSLEADGLVLTVNEAPTGGGLALSQAAEVLLVDTTLRGNRAADHGGGVYQDGGLLHWSGGQLAANEAGGGGGGLALALSDGDDELVLDGVDVVENSPDEILDLLTGLALDGGRSLSLVCTSTGGCPSP